MSRGSEQGQRPHVVIIGAGFGGLAAARALLGEPVDVTLLDANNFHTFQPLLYQVATAGLDAENVAYAIRGSVRGRRRRPANVRVRMARVAAVDLDARHVALLDGDVLDYDSLVVATGAVSHDFGIPGVAEHTLPLKHLEDALALRVHVLTRFEEAAADASIATDGGLDVVVCGGGPTGVEMAGGLRELYTKVLAKDFPQLPVRRGAHHARRDGRPPADAVHRAVVGAGAAHADAPRRRRPPRDGRARRSTRSSCT